MNCPVCGSANLTEFCRDKRRDYCECACCRLVFVPPAQFLSHHDEKKRYDLHRNDPGDPGYRSFLSRLFLPLSERLQPGSSGLDFGCGPVSTLAPMFEQAGHAMAIFDRFFAPAAHVFQKKYDFITASEVVEHLREPRQELERLWTCLKPGGWLGIMTQFVVDRNSFSAWYYKNDLTHVCFFSERTFRWIAGQWEADTVFADSNVVLFYKNR